MNDNTVTTATTTDDTTTSRNQSSARSSFVVGNHRDRGKTNKTIGTFQLLGMRLSRKLRKTTSTKDLQNTCHPYHPRASAGNTNLVLPSSSTPHNHFKSNRSDDDDNIITNVENPCRRPDDVDSAAAAAAANTTHEDGIPKDSAAANLLVVVVERKEDIVPAEDATDTVDVNDDNDDDYNIHILNNNLKDSKNMLESLGDNPTIDELASIAALRANEYIVECLTAEVDVSSGGTFDRQIWESIPQFSKLDLIVGQHLGKGTFSDVFEVIATFVKEDETPTMESLDVDRKELDQLIQRKFPKNDEENQDEEDEESHNHGTTTTMMHNALQHSRRQTTECTTMIARAATPHLAHTRMPRRHSTDVHPRLANQHTTRTLAMKCLRPQTRSNMDQFMIGVEDLVNETAMLASLDHPNIIKLHGRAGGCENNAFRLSDGVFILLDRLRDTLDDRILSWKKTVSTKKKNTTKGPSPSISQLKAACSIADAMSYLHSKNIVFRDLKPANVGFDEFGVVKLFDFGFAKCVATPADTTTTIRTGKSVEGEEQEEEKEEEEEEKTDYQLLYDRCGTVRYMAPEVGLDLGYSLPADVYSFGILLWEICSLKKPFDNIKSMGVFEKSIFKKGGRPKLMKEWSEDLKGIMTSCWSNMANERPTMLDVTTKMHSQVVVSTADSSTTTSNGTQWKKHYGTSNNKSVGKGFVLLKFRSPSMT